MSCIPTPGMLMGTMVAPSVLNGINQRLGNGATMSDQFHRYHDTFVQRYIEPYRASYESLKKHIVLDDVDLIRPIECMDDMYNISPAMYMPILTYRPVRELYDQGRIEGFDIKHLPDHDPYRHLIKNGSADLDHMDEDGCCRVNYVWTDDDPELDFDEIDAIEHAREYLVKFLDETCLDPTNPYKRRG